MIWVVREKQKKVSEFNAGSKARYDVDKILTAKGFSPLIVNSELNESQGIIKKITLQLIRYVEWGKIIKNLISGDTVIIQYPVRSHTVFFGRILRKIERKKVCIIGIIHDLESLRLAISENSPMLTKLRLKYEELSALKYCSKIIVHNEHMKKAINRFFNIPLEKMINLELFDYLYEQKDEESKAVFKGPVLIAGNLDKNKCGYIYDLPDDVLFNLYGANYDEKEIRNDNITYMGKMNPDELPGFLRGSFGLVWDGPSCETCKGVYGEYLKFNNPHKTSLYLAAGIPVIVWDHSAMADFIKKNRCGIMVDDLKKLKRSLSEIDEKHYSELKRNAMSIGCQVKKGYFLSRCLSQIIDE